MTSDYRQSHCAPGKGACYDARFRENRHRAMVWALEQRVLDHILNHCAPPRPLRLLDFACGTGRILAYLEPRVVSVTGVDVSPEMMAVARQRLPGKELILGDLTTSDLLAGRQFDIITAFRFFPNAQTQLRHDAASALARLLAPDGILVFNNHQNASSTRAQLARLVGRGSAQRYMSHREVVDLLETIGFRIAQVYALAYLPFTERWMPLPTWMVVPIERALASMRLPFPLAGLAQNIVYVAERQS